MYQQKHRIQAALLMVVFALNTVASFACSVGISDRSTDHHKQDVQHSHDKTHSHDEAHQQPAEVADHEHADANHHQQKEKEGDCCSDEVMKLQVTDKNVTAAGQNPLPASLEIFTTLHTFLSSLYRSIGEPAKPALPDLRWQVTATIPDLRIAIQSFQI